MTLRCATASTATICGRWAGLGRTSEAAELFAGILELQPDDQGALRHA